MEPVDPNQRALATAAERLGRLLEQAATDHEIDGAEQRETWRRIAEAAAQVSTYAALVTRDDRAAN